MDKIFAIIRGLLPEGTELDAGSSNAIQDAVAAHLSSELQGLAAKNDELLGEVKDFKKKFREAEASLKELEAGGVSADRMKKLQEENEELRNASTNGQGNEYLSKKEREEAYSQGKALAYTEFKPKLEAVEIERDQWKGDAERYKAEYLDYRTRADIMKALDSADIMTDTWFLAGLEKQARVEYNTETKDFSVSLPADNGSHLPVTEWTTYFRGLPEGKVRVRAPQNRGGNGLGSSASDAAKAKKSPFAW